MNTYVAEYNYKQSSDHDSYQEVVDGMVEEFYEHIDGERETCQYMGLMVNSGRTLLIFKLTLEVEPIDKAEEFFKEMEQEFITNVIDMNDQLALEIVR